MTYIVFTDKDLICGATEYYNNTSFDGRIDKNCADEKWREITSNNRSIEFRDEKYRNDHSANIIATDRWGNMLALFHSINTTAWGSNGIFLMGIYTGTQHVVAVGGFWSAILQDPKTRKVLKTSVLYR